MSATEFGLLGPLLVRHDNAVLPVAPGKQRVLLAALLFKANQAVSVPELAETLWEGPLGAPASARVTVQNYVKRLRIALRVTGVDRIVTRPDGYVIRVDAAEFDVARFAELAAGSRRAAAVRAWVVAESQACAALALWRGEPLADIAADGLVMREVPRLTEMWLQVTETRIDADLHLGRHGHIVAELRDLTARYPLREHLSAQLMLALARGGNQGDALTVYQQARRKLIDDLGIEPGSELRQLHERILAGDVGPMTSDGDRHATSEPDVAAPRQLPPTVGHFTGRIVEIETLSAQLDDHATVFICAIGGPPGVGKTALAVHWAHVVASRFPDGQLYVNLRGYDPDQPMAAASALSGFLRALGVPGSDLPADTAERSALYRTLLAGKRVLVVADNAADVEQVRPLLPGTPGCAVVVTSRDSLAGLIARDGARRVELDLLPRADAVHLLSVLIGERADSEPQAVARLAEQCGRLPLALRVAAELAAVRRDTRLAALVDELADRQRRLDLLAAGGDRDTAVRSVFSWSYRHLSGDTGRMFRVVGLHPGLDFDIHAAAALADTPTRTAARLLDLLCRAHLDAARCNRSLRSARPSPCLRPRRCHRPGHRGTASGGADPPGRLLLAHRGHRHGHLVPGRAAPQTPHCPGTRPPNRWSPMQ